MSETIKERTAFSEILKKVKRYYNEKITQYGPTPHGVDWNSEASQKLRFEQLLRICDRTSFSINDYGCGYGALVDYMIGKGYTFEYRGFDLCQKMIDGAKQLHQNLSFCQFSSDEDSLVPADYTVVSGVFNVRPQINDQEWIAYILHALEILARLSVKGFAFNLLTKYAEEDKKRPDLYYADPCFFFDYCGRKFSKRVSLIHDYELYEFTILVRKGS